MIRSKDTSLNPLRFVDESSNKLHVANDSFEAKKRALYQVLDTVARKRIKEKERPRIDRIPSTEKRKRKRKMRLPDDIDPMIGRDSRLLYFLVKTGNDYPWCERNYARNEAPAGNLHVN